MTGFLFAIIQGDCVGAESFYRQNASDARETGGTGEFESMIKLIGSNAEKQLLGFFTCDRP
jgi:hypothetical protein